DAKALKTGRPRTRGSVAANPDCQPVEPLRLEAETLGIERVEVLQHGCRQFPFLYELLHRGYYDRLTLSKNSRVHARVPPGISSLPRRLLLGGQGSKLRRTESHELG